VKWNVVWNPGANEATTVEVSHYVLIENQELDAGRYSLWVIPDKEGPWTLIFSAEPDAWHAAYPRGHDALRVEIMPTSGEHMETLAFYFPVVGSSSVTLNLHWGKTILPMQIRLKDDMKR
jgi:hypothetical protein